MTWAERIKLTALLLAFVLIVLLPFGMKWSRKYPEQCWTLMLDGTNQLYRVDLDVARSMIVTNPVIFEREK